MMTDERRDRMARTVAVAALLALALVLSCHKLRSVDLPWHLKAGEWILEHRAAPRVDMFSFTREGEEWIDAQWLFQVVCQGWLRTLGSPGLTVFLMTASAAILALLFFSTSNRAPPGTRCFFGLVFLLAVRFRLNCRPELLSFLYLAAMFFCLERARRGGKVALLLVPLLQLLWVNSEGIWPIGLAVQGAYLGDEAVDAWRRGEFSWKRPVRPAGGAVLLASALFSFAQPYGLRGALFPWVLFREITFSGALHKQVIGEFQPLLSSGFQSAEALPFVALALGAVAMTARSGRRARPFLSVLGLFFIYLGFSAVRNIGIAGVVLYQALVVHAEVRPEVRGESQVGPGPGFWLTLSRRSVNMTGLVSAVMVAATLLQPVRTWDQSRHERGWGLSRTSYPRRAARFLHTIEYEGRIMTDGAMGNWLIWSGWPGWMVSWDTRMELGGEAALTRNVMIFTDLSVFNEVAKTYQADAAALYHLLPEQRRFALELVRDPAWALVFVDRNTAVFLRRGSRWQPVIEQREVDMSAPTEAAPEP